MFSSPTHSSHVGRRRSNIDGVSNSMTNRRAPSRSVRLESHDGHDPATNTSTFGPQHRSVSGVTLGAGGAADTERGPRWQWVPQSGQQVPKGRRFHAAVSIGWRFYAFGGEQRSENSVGNEKKKMLLNDLVMYDAVKQIWSVLSGVGEPFPKSRKGHSLVAWGTKLVLFGGAGNESYLNDVWFFETRPAGSSEYSRTPVSSSWIQMQTTSGLTSPGSVSRSQRQLTSSPPGGASSSSHTPPKCPQPRAYHSAVIHENSMYVYGGYGFSSQTPDAELWRLDLTTSSWEAISSVSTAAAKPGRRYGHVACAYSGAMFVFGGQVRSCLNDNDVWRLNLSTLEWKVIPSKRANRPVGNTTTNVAVGAYSQLSPCPRTYHAGTLLKSQGRWLIHGGSSEDRTFGDLHEFNLRAEKWKLLPSCSTPVPIEGHALVTTTLGITSLFVVGGSPAGPLSLSSPALRLDLLDANHPPQLRLEELILSPQASASLLEFVQKFIASQEIQHLLTLEVTKLQQECSRAQAAAPHSSDVSDAQLELEDLADKLRIVVEERDELQKRLQEGGQPGEVSGASHSVMMKSIQELKETNAEYKAKLEGQARAIQELQQALNEAKKAAAVEKASLMVAPLAEASAAQQHHVAVLRSTVLGLLSSLESLGDNTEAIRVAVTSLPAVSAMKVTGRVVHLVTQDIEKIKGLLGTDEVVECLVHTGGGSGGGGGGGSGSVGQIAPPSNAASTTRVAAAIGTGVDTLSSLSSSVAKRTGSLMHDEEKGGDFIGQSAVATRIRAAQASSAAVSLINRASTKDAAHQEAKNVGSNGAMPSEDVATSASPVNVASSTRTTPVVAANVVAATGPVGSDEKGPARSTSSMASGVLRLQSLKAKKVPTVGVDVKLQAGRGVLKFVSRRAGKGKRQSQRSNGSAMSVPPAAAAATAVE